MGSGHQGVPGEELEVLRLHMEGLSDEAIARRVGVSVATVRRRAARARQRCQARTRAEAIAMLAAAGVLPVAPLVITTSHEVRSTSRRTLSRRSTGEPQ